MFTFISPRVVESLELKPYREGEIMGIGGNKITKTYMVHIGLPDDTWKVVEVYRRDIDFS